MNQHQIKVVLENVNLIKEAFNVTGDRAFTMYKEMIKVDYDEYIGLKEKVEVDTNTLQFSKAHIDGLDLAKGDNTTFNITCNCNCDKMIAQEFAKKFTEKFIKKLKEELKSYRGGI